MLMRLQKQFECSTPITAHAKFVKNTSSKNIHNFSHRLQTFSKLYDASIKGSLQLLSNSNSVCYFNNEETTLIRQLSVKKVDFTKIVK